MARCALEQNIALNMAEQADTSGPERGKKRRGLRPTVPFKGAFPVT